jgi:hypothetical protein
LRIPPLGGNLHASVIASTLDRDQRTAHLPWHDAVAASSFERQGRAKAMEERKSGHRRTITEEIEIAGSQLVEKIKELVAEGNLRQLRIKASDGDVFFEMPLTVGAVAGGVIVLAAPLLAVVGVIAAMVANVKVEIVREAPDDEAGSDNGAEKEDEKKTAA